MQTNKLIGAVIAGSLTVLNRAIPGGLAEALHHRAVSEAEVRAAQRARADGLIEISTAFVERGREEAVRLAETFMDRHYAYALDPVLYKPTLAQAPQTVRTTREGALAYFVRGQPDHPHDTGFAFKGWSPIDIDNAAIFLEGDTATTMGRVRFVHRDGQAVTVEKTRDFIKDDAGLPRIVVHDSSLEYTDP